MSNKNIKDAELIEFDSVEEAREVLKYALESRRWDEVEDAFALLDEILGYETDGEDEEDKRNRLEE